MKEAEQRYLIERYVAAYNRFDVAGMLELMTDDVRFENVSGGEVTASASGKADLRTLAERSAALFSERAQRLTRIEFRGDAALASIAYRGVLVSGAVVELTGESEFGFRGDRICRIVDRS
jgi:ketosteroid isomerase-like protein